MCHRFKKQGQNSNNSASKNGSHTSKDHTPVRPVEPLPESSRERRDGPGGEA